MDFMRYSMYLLLQNGFNVILPDEFSAKGQQRLTAQMIIKPLAVETQKSKRGTGMTPLPYLI